MTSKHQKELDALKDKYERMILELKANASSDKDFMEGQLKKKIGELESEIEEMKRLHAREKEALMGGQGKIVEEFE